MRKIILLLLLLSQQLFAQVQLPIDSVFLKAYQKGTRDISGMPGKKYWQNTADYQIKVQFNPTSRLVSGQIQISYHNNSPDTLNQIWFKLYPNLYKKGTERKSKIADKDLNEGLQIHRLFIKEQAAKMTSYTVQGTNMVVDVPALLPGKSLNFEIDYQYLLNEGSHVRTGMVDEGSAFVAYFFPRIAVYDDIDGWNKYPYTGSEEFYNDFSNFQAEITVPKSYVVWATGDYQNIEEVFQPLIAERIKRAEQDDQVYQIIGPDDLSANAVLKDRDFNTFKFAAKQVPDFVFALSKHYVWQSSSLVVDSLTKRRTRVDAVYHPKHKDYAEVLPFSMQTISAMSFVFPKWPFPYSHMTVFDGLDQMEYPMMANDNPTDTREDAITLTNHEIFHTMFPFYMGTNETKYAWMDEGWATIGEWKISNMIDSNYIDDYGIEPTARSSGSKADTPIMTLTPQLSGSGSFTNSYPKPAFGYLFLEEYLGPERFIKALHHYIKTWNGKHPMPYDFFMSMNAGAGEDLNWFWKSWFFSEGVTDLALKQVNKSPSGFQVLIENKSVKPLPVHLKLIYADGTEEIRRHSIGVWKSGSNLYIENIETQKSLKRVELGSTYVPDKNKSDNVWEADVP